LIDALQNDYWLRRSRAAEALGKLGPAAKDAVRALRNALRDSHREVRREAAEALAKIGPEAAEAVADLVASLGDPDLGISAQNALEAIGPPAISQLISTLGHPERGQFAELVLHSIGERAIDHLLCALEIDNQRARSRVVSLISSIAPAGRSDVIDAMAKFAIDKNQARHDRFLAAYTLEKLDPKKAGQLDVRSIYNDLFKES
jgi:HEAT repeat protein